MAGFDVHQAIGGTAGWRRLSVAFYSRVERDPLLRPLFPGTRNLHCAIEAFTAFLVQRFGGPGEDTQRRWFLSLKESHLRFQIGQPERTAWMKHMRAALDEVVEEPLRGALREFFEQSSAYVAHQEKPPAVTEDRSDATREEMRRRWDGQRELDEAVDAVQRGDAARAVALAEKQASSTVLAGLLVLMMGSREPALLRYVHQKFAGDPRLARERHFGRTMLHEAAARGNPGLVELLLELGIDPNVKDGGRHTPLYAVANGNPGPGGGEVVRALVGAGADVNANDGVKHCTPLHMAARRGNVGVAAALLDCGARIDARDSLGVTPLGRAINCRKAQVADLLRARGAAELK